MSMSGQSSADRIALHRAFVARFAVESTSNPQSKIPPTADQLDSVEKDLGARFPASYRAFVLSHGSVWTPHLSDSLTQNTDEYLRAIEEFTPADKIIVFNQGWDASIPTPLLLFASDSLGDMVGFPRQSGESDDLPVMVFDHEFTEVERLAESFDLLLSMYLRTAAGT